MAIRYRFEAKLEQDTYTVTIGTSHYPYERWKVAGVLTLTRDEWEQLRDMLGRFSVSVRMQEAQMDEAKQATLAG